jgi:AGCS family alanine or glycine:cation symporter
MILGMAFPNLIGVYFLHGKVRNAINEYWARYKSGAMPVYK